MGCTGTPRCTDFQAKLLVDLQQVEIPELDLEVSTGTMGGLISTVEGLLDTMSQTLKGTQVSCHCGHACVPLVLACIILY